MKGLQPKMTVSSVSQETATNISKISQSSFDRQFSEKQIDLIAVAPETFGLCAGKEIERKSCIMTIQILIVVSVYFFLILHHIILFYVNLVIVERM